MQNVLSDASHVTRKNIRKMKYYIRAIECNQQFIDESESKEGPPHR